MPGNAMEAPRRHRLTVEDFYRMGDAGILRPDERVELIEGEIIDMPPPGSRHAGTTKQLASILHQAVGSRAIVQVQDPISLDEYSEPQPDLALLRPRADFYRSAHPRPEDVLLVVEVAATLRYDREVKTPLYARHGVPEVWVLDVENRQLTRYRDPAEGGYARVDQPSVAAPIGLDALADARIDLAALLDE